MSYQDLAIPKVRMSSFLNPLDASLRACIELDKAIRSQRGRVDWQKAMTFIEYVARDRDALSHELYHVIEPIEVTQYSAGVQSSAGAAPNQEYRLNLEQLTKCLGEINGNLAGANDQVLSKMRDACWNIHRILLIARNTRLAHD